MLPAAIVREPLPDKVRSALGPGWRWRETRRGDLLTLYAAKGRLFTRKRVWIMWNMARRQGTLGVLKEWHAGALVACVGGFVMPIFVLPAVFAGKLGDLQRGMAIGVAATFFVAACIAAARVWKAKARYQADLGRRLGLL